MLNMVPRWIHETAQPEDTWAIYVEHVDTAGPGKGLIKLMGTDPNASESQTP